MGNYRDAKPEDIIGKTIKSVTINGNMVDMAFTDGDEFMAELRYVGYNGATLDSTFWPKDPEATESPSDSGSRKESGGSHE